MARGLVWSPEAIEDIESIASYIERDSVWYAKAVASKIVETAEPIPEYPELGRIVPEVGDPAIRERIAYSYRRQTAGLRRNTLYRCRHALGSIACPLFCRDARRDPRY